MRRRLLIFLIPPLFVLGAKLCHDRWEHARGVKAVFGGLAREPYRRLAVRLSYPPADQHRPFSAPCDQESCREHYRHADLARLEKAGDVAGLVAAYVLSGEYDAALRLIDTRPELESDRAAVLAQDPRRLEEALAAADRARGSRALWNRAILLEGMGLPLAAARDFHAVERFKEPGWSEESAQRALRLESDWHSRVRVARQVDAEAAKIDHGQLPSEQTRRSHPDAARRFFFSAVRERKPGQDPAPLRAIARALDDDGHTHSLVPMVDEADVLRRLVTLYQANSVAAAAEYRRLAQELDDPWFLARAEWVVGRAAIEAGDPVRADAAFHRALERCAARWFPDLCIENKIWLAHIHADQRHLQEARRWALEARQDAQVWTTPAWQVAADAQLASIEELRERLALGRAYAEEVTLQDLDCSSAASSRALLAFIDVEQRRIDDARREIDAIKQCPGSRDRFGQVAMETLAALARVGGPNAHAERALFSEAMEHYRPFLATLRPAHRVGLERYEAEVMLATDRPRARATLERLSHDGSDEEVGRLGRLLAATTLAMDAGEHGDLASALDTIARTAGVPGATPCTMGVVDEGGRRLEIARGPRGDLRGDVLLLSASHPDPPVGEALRRHLDGCPEVGVVATAPVLGRSRLLPAPLAWSYRHSQTTAPARAHPLRHVVVSEPTPPEVLGLPRLAAFTPHPPGGDEVIEWLHGAEASPAQVMARALDADLVEWHVHGIVDLEVSDAAALALSPDDGGQSLLMAREIAGHRFTRAPGIILGACRAALSARYGDYQWSLPLAFLRAGASWVLASPSPVEDLEAPVFFGAVWTRILAGARPAVALRDERAATRWQSSYHHWTDEVVLFE